MSLGSSKPKVLNRTNQKPAKRNDHIFIDIGHIKPSGGLIRQV